MFLPNVISAQLIAGQGQGPAAPQASVEPDYVEAELGQSLQVQCSAQGNPAPTIQWYSIRQTLITTSDGVLKFSSVRKSDQGEYTCTATNPSGTSTARVTIVVRSGKNKTLNHQLAMSKGVRNSKNLRTPSRKSEKKSRNPKKNPQNPKKSPKSNLKKP